MVPSSIIMSGNSSGGITTISNLTPSTTYFVKVSAENCAGIGSYSVEVTALTLGMM